MASARIEESKDCNHAGAGVLPTSRADRGPIEHDRLSPSQRREAFLARLARMSEEERVRAARHGGFTALERSIWVARFPEQVPLVNGEVEWIALTLADLD